MKCTKCDGPLVVEQQKFHWRGKWFSGLVCKPCKALWDDPNDSFHGYVAKHAGPHGATPDNFGYGMYYCTTYLAWAPGLCHHMRTWDKQ